MDSRAARAEQRRRTAVLRKSRLARTEHDMDPIRGERAVALVEQLTRESWAESGRPLPSYTRDTIPIRFVPGRPT
jgi:hypothetical protein